MQPPFYTLDLVAANRLPPQWQDDVRLLADSPAREVLYHGSADMPPESAGLLATVDGAAIRSALPWMWTLYHTALRSFAAESVGYPLFPANRLRAALTLNILAHEGASAVWHTDPNAVTGVLYAAVPDLGGELMFRDGAGGEAVLRPRAGLFVCFEGAVEHQVAPLKAGGYRLAIVMLYYRSASEQPHAFGTDIYTLGDG